MATKNQDSGEKGSTFKDRLAQWHQREAKIGDRNVSDDAASRSKEFVRLAVKKQDIVNHQDHKVPLVQTSPSPSPRLKKDASPKGVPPKIVTSETSDNISSGMNEIDMVRGRLRRVRSNKKLRTKSVRAKRLRDFHKKVQPTLTKKNATAEQTLREALKKNFVLDSIPDDTLHQLVEAFEDPISFRAGDVIIQQGDVGDYFYVIESGEVLFEVNGNVVGSAEDGTSFGELALLYSSPRAATVKATVTTSLWRLDQASFCYVLHSQSKASKDAKVNLLKNISFFQQMNPSDIEHCTNVMMPYKYEAGEVIVRKGEVGNAFYIIETGEVIVTDISVGDTTYEDVTLGAGDFFGERGLVKSEPRAANVVGIKPGTLFSINRETFERVCGSFVRLILKCQDQGRLSSLKAIKAANLESQALSELTQFIVDEVYREGDTIFAENEQTTPALYLVRDGQIKYKDQNGNEKVIKEGEYFGEDHLWADAKGIVLKNGQILAQSTAIVADPNTICGVLALSDCRKVYDTRNIELFVDQEQSEQNNVAEEKDEEEFYGIVSTRRSQRMSVDVNILEKSLQREALLGEGQFGAVWRVTADKIGDNSKFALKILSKENTDVAVDSIKRECQILGSIYHPFVVDLVHSYEDAENFYMVMRLIKGCELWAVIHRERDDGEFDSGIPEDHAKFYFTVIFDTLAYLHGHLLAFRDLKPENIMIDEDGYPIMIDFGFAKVLKDGVTYTLCGTPQYIAPEIIKNTGHGLAVDHWAAGVILYEMIAGESPFFYEGIDNITLFSDICKEPPYPLPEECQASDEVRDLIDRLLVKDPTQRMGSLAMGSREIAEHSWFAGIDLQAARTRSLQAPART